jgi:hypothetical protein
MLAERVTKNSLYSSKGLYSYRTPFSSKSSIPPHVFGEVRATKKPEAYHPLEEEPSGFLKDMFRVRTYSSFTHASVGQTAAHAGSGLIPLHSVHFSGTM